MGVIRRLSSIGLEDGVVRGIAATWDLVEADGFRLVRGCFAGDDLLRTRPLLWCHRAYDVPIGVVRSLVEDDDGLRFEATLNDSSMARDVAASIGDGSTRDVSIYARPLAADAEGAVTRASLLEVSLVPVGFGADPGAGIGRTLEDSELCAWIRAQFARLG